MPSRHQAKQKQENAIAKTKLSNRFFIATRAGDQMLSRDRRKSNNDLTP
jgi:hypothetical protein